MAICELPGTMRTSKELSISEKKINYLCQVKS